MEKLNYYSHFLKSESKEDFLEKMKTHLGDRYTESWAIGLYKIAEEKFESGCESAKTWLVDK